MGNEKDGWYFAREYKLTDENEGEELISAIQERTLPARDVSENFLIGIIRETTTAIRLEACRRILVKKPTNEQLRYVITHANDRYVKLAAWESLRAQEPTREDLRYIIRRKTDSPGDPADMACGVLLGLEPTLDDLLLIYRTLGKDRKALLHIVRSRIKRLTKRPR